jgi:branched-chain amino acid transport system permease protein
MLSVLPQNIFDPFWGLLTLLNCVIGGIGTIFGPILGALVMVFLTNLVGAVFVGIQRLIVGLVLVLFVIMFPEGLMPFFRRWLRRSYLR